MPRFYGSLFGPIGVSSITGQVLWAGVKGKEGEQATIGVSQIGSAETPREIRTDLPKRFVAQAAWDDGQGGWFVSGSERLADGAWHTTIWSLNALGRARRLACDPEVGRYVVLGDVSPSGVFIAASAQQLDYYTEIAFVPRQ